MYARKIVKIDEEKCDGCGLCATACHEGAIEIVEGKARLVSEEYCDGLGDCLAECPQGAITIEEREAKPFDEKAVHERLAKLKHDQRAELRPRVHSGCPGSAMRMMKPDAPEREEAEKKGQPSQLGHWPVQLMLVPPGAPFLKGADLLIAADCVPFAFADFHARYLAGKALLVGCPKLDDLEYYFGKLKAIFAKAKPRSITVLRMEVPCCGGIAKAAIQARNEVIPDTTLELCTIKINGEELSCVGVDARSAS